MSVVTLSDKLLADLAGWEVVKQARTIVAENRVLSSSWEPPLLRGVVQSGSSSYRAGLVIRRENDAENLCPCRQSREWGTLCPHSIAVGLHFLKPAPPAILPPPQGQPRPTPAGKPVPGTAPTAAIRSSRDVRRLRRAVPGEETDAEPLEIHVIFPPNLADGLARGKATVFFEGRWRRGTIPMASLPLDVPFQLGDADRRLLDAAELLALGDTPAMLQLGAADLAGLLGTLVDHPRATFGKARPALVLSRPWPAPLSAKLEANGEITLRVRPLPRPPVFLPGPKSWVLDGTSFQPLELPAEVLPVLSQPLRIPRSGVPQFLGQTLGALQQTSGFEADFTGADFELSPAPPRFLLQLAGGLAMLTAQLQCRYGQQIVTPGITPVGAASWMPDPANVRRYSTRDTRAERNALDRLTANGFTGPDARGLWQLNGQNQVLTFLAREYPRLGREWEVTLEERLQRSTDQNLERIDPHFTITPSGEQWFDLQIQFSTSGGDRIPATEIQRLLRGGQTHTRLKNGRFALIDTGAVEELEEILVDCAPEQHDGSYRLSQAQAGFLDSTLRHQGWQPVAPAAWKERALQQTGEARLDCPPLGDLEGVLRPYQKHGVAWLAFLRRNGFGGILADEMGLGKTLQTLALLVAQRREPSRPRPSLVVCPTSLVFNWAAEAARFAPDLVVLPLHGSQRHARFSEIPSSDLVITSYTLVRRDFERHRGLQFDTVILDEAQHIKNRETQNAQAVKALRSRHRLVLTGTPLENSVLDLWSLFDFLMPGFLGTARDFKDRYELPIVREKDAATQARLARRVRPFLLRRLKRDVAPELPARIDQVVWCELTDAQGAVYTQLLDATRREVTESVGAQGLARSRMLVLTAILRLRQACCDLRLLGVEPDAPGNPPDTGAETPPARPTTSPTAPADSSGKLEAFGELLEEALDGGHRLLVFSQFTRMLGLLKERLSADAIPFCYLDGATRDRAAVVARFQQSADIPVFLISLKAGGVGLNLTAADTVVHFDPWWNPAVEDQATDRAHRIGQQRVVTSYKLITRGTIEEKILALQERKRVVVRGLLAGEEQLSESLSWDEIQDLLA